MKKIRHTIFESIYLAIILVDWILAIQAFFLIFCKGIKSIVQIHVIFFLWYFGLEIDGRPIYLESANFHLYLRLSYI